MAKDTTNATRNVARTNIGRNITAEMDGNVLILRVDTKLPGAASASGKSIVVGTTQGNVSVPGMGDLKIGVNVYRPN